MVGAAIGRHDQRCIQVRIERLDDKMLGFVRPGIETAGSISQRALSPTLTELMFSPGCNCTSQICSTAQTTEGSEVPKANNTAPSVPGTGLMPSALSACQRRAIDRPSRWVRVRFGLRGLI
jgi:hypothetical protein